MIGQDAGGDSQVARSQAGAASGQVTFDHLRLMAEFASDLVYQTNPAGIIEWISPSVVQVLGWEPDELLGTPSIDLIHPDDVRSVQSYRARQDAGEIVEDHLTRLRTKQGAYRWMSARLRPVFDGSGAPVARVVGVHDVHEEMIVRKAIQTLSQGNGVLVRATSEDGLLQRMCDTIVESGQYRCAWYGRPVDDAAKSVEVVAQSGDHWGYLDHITVTWGDEPTAMGPTGTAIRTGQTQGSRDFQNDPQIAPWRAIAVGYGFRSSLALPVIVGGRLGGVLTVYGAEADEFDQEARALLTDLADDIGYGLARLRDQAQLAEALVNSTYLLAATVEARDIYTAGHQSNVSELSVRIGQELNLDEDRLLGLNLGANIHDLGKIVTPLEILNKPGPLTLAELDQVRIHSRVGWQIANRFQWPWPIAEMIHQHHERLDGSGYPQGLKGEQILLEARIIAVADVYDAIRHDRPYRESPGKERALEVLTAEQGTKFDTDIVEALLGVLATGYDLPATQLS